ncbi:MAG: dTMP kinase [Candidatus Aenigmatarchaeota archaeon]
MSKGFFINFEGIDSSGKKTQASLLANYLRSKGLDVVEMSFPAYDTIFGKHVAAFLRGEYGKKDDMPEIAALLFAIDRYQFKDFIKQNIDKGRIIVCNRYTQSAMAFEGTLCKDKKDFIKWLGIVESRLPQPDLIILLDMHTKISTNLIRKREKKDYLKDREKDILEEDIEYQENVRKTYLEMAKDKKWIVIECFEGERPKTIEEIHKEIVEKVNYILIKNKILA